MSHFDKHIFFRIFAVWHGCVYPIIFVFDGLPLDCFDRGICPWALHLFTYIL